MPELYFKPKTSEELIKYLSLVSKAAPNTPLLYYHIPSFTNVNSKCVLTLFIIVNVPNGMYISVNMPEFLTKAEGKIDTLVGIKFTSCDLVEGAECIKVCNGKYAIFLGADQVQYRFYCYVFKK